MTFEELHPDDQAFLGWLASLLRLRPAEVLERCLEASDGTVSTEVEHGRFVGLDLRWIGRGLRWNVGELPELELPTRYLEACRALDCSGMSLDQLPCDGMPALQILECGDNRLSQLELGGNAQLVQLGCAGNRLMLLDLRRNPRLARVDCTGNQISALVLPEAVPLAVLRCGRNQLISLDLRSLDALVEVVCSRNALRRLEVGSAPRLEILDCSDNEISELDLAEPLPRLRELSCANNSLAHVPATWFPSLRVLDAHKNYIDRLDLRTNLELEEVDVRKNQLQKLRLANPRLVQLDAGYNRLRQLDLTGCPELLELRCNRNELDQLVLEPVPKLCGLWCGENRLETLDLDPMPDLAVLSAPGNPLRELDLHPATDLAHVEVDPDTAVLCSETQRDRLFSPPVAAPDPTATPGQLHRLVRSYKGPNAERMFLEVVRLPQCDLGTALLAYWTSNPKQYARYTSREQLSPWELDGWDLLVTIEDRVSKGDFGPVLFRFDPKNDRQTRSVRGFDWTSLPGAGRAERPIPKAMFGR